MGLCPQRAADTRSELGRRVRLPNREIRDKKNEKHLNWTGIRGKKKAAKDAVLLILVAVLTFIVLMAIFGVWTSAGSIVTAVGRKSRSVKRPSDWYLSAGI
jgi:hypothetical protein